MPLKVVIDPKDKKKVQISIQKDEEKGLAGLDKVLWDAVKIYHIRGKILPFDVTGEIEVPKKPVEQGNSLIFNITTSDVNDASQFVEFISPSKKPSQAKTQQTARTTTPLAAKQSSLQQGGGMMAEMLKKHAEMRGETTEPTSTTTSRSKGQAVKTEPIISLKKPMVPAPSSTTIAQRKETSTQPSVTKTHIIPEKVSTSSFLSTGSAAKTMVTSSAGQLKKSEQTVTPTSVPTLKATISTREVTAGTLVTPPLFVLTKNADGTTNAEVIASSPTEAEKILKEVMNTFVAKKFGFGMEHEHQGFRFLRLKQEELRSFTESMKANKVKDDTNNPLRQKSTAPVKMEEHKKPTTFTPMMHKETPSHVTTTAPVKATSTVSAATPTTGDKIKYNKKSKGDKITEITITYTTNVVGEAVSEKINNALKNFAKELNIIAEKNKITLTPRQGSIPDEMYSKIKEAITEATMPSSATRRKM